MFFYRCKTSVSPLPGTFFSSDTQSGSSKLHIKKILKILYYWSLDETIEGISNLVKINPKTVQYWLKKIRSVCVESFEQRKKFGGDGYIVEIDESLLRGKRKHNRGRYLKRDKWEVKPQKEFLRPERVTGIINN